MQARLQSIEETREEREATLREAREERRALKDAAAHDVSLRESLRAELAAVVAERNTLLERTAQQGERFETEARQAGELITSLRKEIEALREARAADAAQLGQLERAAAAHDSAEVKRLERERHSELVRERDDLSARLREALGEVDGLQTKAVELATSRSEAASRLAASKARVASLDEMMKRTEAWLEAQASEPSRTIPDTLRLTPYHVYRRRAS